MAKVYARVGGKKLTKIIAMTEQAQAGVDGVAQKIGVEAEGLLAAHVHDGHSRITLEKGDVDAYVVLDDERGQAAAMTIEFGRQANADGNGAMEGLAVLRRASGLI